jgi:adenine-specific DNA-methyltransferase
MTSNFIKKANGSSSGNLLIFGENLQSLRALLSSPFNLEGKIDLIYIDPPFATRNNFTITNGRANSISNSKNGNLAYSDKLIGEGFIDFIKDRLVLLKKLLSDQGSIYLHIDYKIGHYVKVIMDEVFGINNFRNDITRIKTNPKNFPRIGYGNIKDLILFYSKTDSPIWHEPQNPYSGKDIQTLFKKMDKNGRRYATVPLHAPGETENGASAQMFKGNFPPAGRHWRTNVKQIVAWDKKGLIEWSKNGNPRKKIYLDEKQGKRVQDIWDFKDPPYPAYPTEKNLEMLKLIVSTSSNENSYVLDCFCGSGTTLIAAHESNRRWIGIDQSKLAIQIAKDRLSKIKPSLLVKGVDYSEYIVGQPAPEISSRDYKLGASTHHKSFAAIAG